MLGWRRKRERGAVDAVALLVVVALGGVATIRCGEEDPGPNVVPEDGRAVLRQLADHVLLPTYERFAVIAAALEAACDAYAISADDADRAAAQTVWIDAMAVWQRLEVMQVGPAAAVDRPGGRGLRDEVDSWPLTNECRIDSEVVEAAYVDRDAFAAELPNVRGLDALEYLLFHDGPDNACDPASEINAAGTWAALDPTELAARRAAYAATLAHLVRVQADVLRDAWRPDGEDYAGRLARADAEPFVDPVLGLVSILDALLYLDAVVKDQKLSATDAAQTESPHAQRSREHVHANLEAAEELFFGAPRGTDAPGFDDLLRAAGEHELPDRMGVLFADARAALDAIGEPLETAITSRPEAVAAARDALGRVTTELKGPLVTVLRIRIPGEAGGDTD